MHLHKLGLPPVATVYPCLRILLPAVLQINVERFVISENSLDSAPARRGFGRLAAGLRGPEIVIAS